MSTAGVTSMDESPIKILRLPQVCDVTGLGRSMIYQMESRSLVSIIIFACASERPCLMPSFKLPTDSLSWHYFSHLHLHCTYEENALQHEKCNLLFLLVVRETPS
jgi:hypothetical protein